MKAKIADAAEERVDVVCEELGVEEAKLVLEALGVADGEEHCHELVHALLVAAGVLAAPQEQQRAQQLLRLAPPEVRELLARPPHVRPNQLSHLALPPRRVRLRLHRSQRVELLVLRDLVLD